MTRLFRQWMLPLACLAILTIGDGHGQPQPPEEPPRIKALLKSDPPPPQAADPPATPARSTPPTSVDDLITRLEKLRQQKAELEKQEREVVEQLREIVKSQADRLSRLGINLGGPEPKEAVNRAGGLPSLPKK
jgi:hypothetical protein